MCLILAYDYQIIFMDNLTQSYAHLEYESKIAAANAMTWVKETSLAQGISVAIVDTEEQEDSKPQKAFLNMLHDALASGVPVEIVQTGLKQIDVTADTSLMEQFEAFVQSSAGSVSGINNCQLIKV